MISMNDRKCLLDRLRHDGNPWAQPLFDEAATRIADLERQLAEARKENIRERGLTAEWHERAVAAERQLVDELTEAREAASECCDGYEGQISMLQAVLRDTQGQLADAQAEVIRLTMLNAQYKAYWKAAEEQYAAIRAARAAVWEEWKQKSPPG
jgi:uncharacterized protein involved in exopolysaccharide biosynthesis